VVVLPVVGEGEVAVHPVVPGKDLFWSMMQMIRGLPVSLLYKSIAA
jgi:hypothetical protein